MDQKTNNIIRHCSEEWKNKRKLPDISGPTLAERKLEENRSRIAKDKEEDSDNNL